MKILVSVLLVAVGLLNLFPLVGVISSDQLAALYGVSFEQSDLVILMRHRAVMFGLIGGFILLAAFRSSLQLLAAIAGLVSMSSFVLLAFLAGETGSELNRVVIADIIGSIVAAFVLVVAIRDRHTAA